MVYIREAHAIDSRSPMGGSGHPIVEDPKTLEERRAVAEVCLTKLEIEAIPALVDDMQDTANVAYGAWPDRLYLVGRDGRIAYKGSRGPFGFEPDELADAIEEELEVGGDGGTTRRRCPGAPDRHEVWADSGFLAGVERDSRRGPAQIRIVARAVGHRAR